MEKIKVKMSRKSFDKWLSDLRSGEFEQGFDYLYDGKQSYCCMGVYCTQFPDLWEDSPEGSSLMLKPGYISYIPYDDPFDVLISKDRIPNAARKRMFLENDIVHVYEVLGVLNDSLKWSFEEIAEWAELNLEPEN